MTKKLTRQRAMQLRPMDDLLFNLIYQDKAACQELIRIVLNDNTIVVTNVVAQDTIPNLSGRGVRLDVSCETSDGKCINVEIQRANDDDHYRRIRYNASVITSNKTPKSKKFKDVAEVYIIYITEFDIIHTSETVCHLDTVIRETGEIIDDGLHRVVVNTTKNDGTKAARLISHFKESYFEDAEFPEISSQIKRYKHTEKGRKIMCKAVEDLIREQNEYRDAVTFVDYVNKFSTTYHIPVEEICVTLDKTYDDYLNAKKIIESVDPEIYELEYA